MKTLIAGILLLALHLSAPAQELTVPTENSISVKKGEVR